MLNTELTIRPLKYREYRVSDLYDSSFIFLAVALLGIISSFHLGCGGVVTKRRDQLLSEVLQLTTYNNISN